MTTLIVWIILCYGVTLIVTGSKLFEPLRRLAKSTHPMLGVLLHCPMCFGFWVGALLSIRYQLGPTFLLWPADSALPTMTPRVFFGAPERALFDGAGASGACWAAHVVLTKLGAEDL